MATSLSTLDTRRVFRALAGLAMMLLVSAGARAQPGERSAEPIRWTDGPREWVLRARAAPDLPADRSAEIMALFAPGLGYLGLGLVAPPMYASALVVGGLLIAPGAAIASMVERRQWERAVAPLLEMDFQRALAKALRERTPLPSHGAEASRFASSPVPASPTGERIEITVNGWGLGGEREHVCFIASVDLSIGSADAVRLRERLVISDARVTPDAPPAQCASLERMGERDGRLVRQAAAEAAAALAVMCLDRVLASAGRRP